MQIQCTWVSFHLKLLLHTSYNFWAPMLALFPPSPSADSSMKQAAKYSFLKSKSTASFINLVPVSYTHLTLPTT